MANGAKPAIAFRKASLHDPAVAYDQVANAAVTPFSGTLQDFAGGARQRHLPHEPRRNPFDVGESCLFIPVLRLQILGTAEADSQRMLQTVLREELVGSEQCSGAHQLRLERGFNLARGSTGENGNNIAGSIAIGSRPASEAAVRTTSRRRAYSLGLWEKAGKTPSA